MNLWCVPYFGVVPQEIRGMRDQTGANDLRAIAYKAMTERGLEPDFPADALQQVKNVPGPARETDHAILAYRSVAAWLDGKDKMPERIANPKGLDEQLRMQDQIAQVMRSVRYVHGALHLESIEPEAVISDGKVVALRVEKQNRAQEL